jgi:hypothetical protein
VASSVVLVRKVPDSNLGHKLDNILTVSWFSRVPSCEVVGTILYIMTDC